MNNFENTDAYKFAMQHGKVHEDLLDLGFASGKVFGPSKRGDGWKVYVQTGIGNVTYCGAGCTFDNEELANEFFRLWNEVRAQD